MLTASLPADFFGLYLELIPASAASLILSGKSRPDKDLCP